MREFIAKFGGKITGSLECFDRVVFKGHLRAISFAEGMEKLLSRHHLRIKDFGPFVKAQSDQLMQHAKRAAAREGRPYQYLARRIRKEDEARRIAQRDGLTKGLVCVFSELESCPSFKVAFAENRPRLRAASRKCLCVYYYFLHPELGLIHVRQQTWFPFVVQIAVNGHEWLARQMQRRGLAFEQIDNAFVHLANPGQAQALADRFASLNWPATLSRLAAYANPLLKSTLDGQSHYWTVDQAEFATDLLFADRAALAPLYRALIQHGLLCLGSEDVLGFLGKKITGNFKADVLKDFKTRVDGMRLKHRVGKNWIKMYDKFGRLLRVETVINHPYGFLIRRHGVRKGKKDMGWFPMTKGVTGLWRYAQVARSANHRYLTALSVANDPAPAQQLLHRCTRRLKRDQRSYRGFNPAAREDLALFKALLQGQHHLHGFRNAAVRAALYPAASPDKPTQRRLAARVHRALKRLHVRGLIARIPRSRRWRVTTDGHAFMGMALKHHDLIYLNTLNRAA